MKPVLAVRHVSHEGLGTISAALARAKCRTQFATRLRRRSFVSIRGRILAWW